MLELEHKVYNAIFFRKFRLFLKVKTDLLSQDFKAYSIDGQGERMLLPSVGQLEIYVGTLDGKY